MSFLSASSRCALLMLPRLRQINGNSLDRVSEGARRAHDSIVCDKIYGADFDAQMLATSSHRFIFSSPLLFRHFSLGEFIYVFSCIQALSILHIFSLLLFILCVFLLRLISISFFAISNETEAHVMIIIYLFVFILVDFPLQRRPLGMTRIAVIDKFISSGEIPARSR